MAEPKLLTIRRDFARIDPALLQRFADAPTGWITDAQNREGALEAGIRCLTRANRIVGTAFTVDAGPRDNLAPYAAIALAKPGDVLIVRTGDHLGHAVTGDIVVGLAKNAGILGYVTDGMVRDLPGIEPLGVPVFARGITPNSPQKNGPGTVGLPISIGGVTVASGDLVIADSEGVVIIPAANVATVAGALEGVRKKEAEMEQMVKDGAKVPGWVTELLAGDSVRWVN